MKTFKTFLEAHTDTAKMDADELKRQKQHLANKAKEYEDQSHREALNGIPGGAASAKAKMFATVGKNI
jgi:hypothetical protein